MKKFLSSKCVAILLFVTIGLLFGRKMLKRHHTTQETEEIMQGSQPVKMNSLFHRISDYKVMYNIPELKLYIYTSYIDRRFTQPILRIFGIEEKGGIKVDLKCTWQDIDGETGIKVTKDSVAKRYWIDTSWPDWSPYYACEYSCAIPQWSKIMDVTLVSSDMKYKLNVPLEMSNQVKSHRREDIAVCIKPFSGYQGTAQLVEWLETIQAVGYRSIIIYNSDITGPGRHILQYYRELGIVKIVDFPYLIAVIQNVESPTLTAEQRYAIYQQIYLVAMHDCLYRFSGLYEYIAFHDLDEIIVPTPSESVSGMLERARAAFPMNGGFMFYTLWHWEDFGPVNATEELYMQKYAKCTGINKQQPRSIVSTDRVIAINFHEVLDVPVEKFKSITLFPEDYGAVHSYKGKCSSKFNSAVCGKMLIEEVNTDKTVARYKAKVSFRVKSARNHLKMH